MQPDYSQPAHVYVWHFAGDTLLDGSPLPPPGEVLPEIPDVQLCQRGYHGSVNPLDALTYAPGFFVSKQRIWGNLFIGDDKCVGSFREGMTPYINVERVLRKFARMGALDVLHLWNAPQIVREYLITGHAHLGDAAWGAARGAARATARDVARDAAWGAARGAARATARDVARDAAWATARAAAGEAAWATAWATARDVAREAAWATARATARAAAWNAAWAAVWDAQARRLSSMLHEALASHPFDPEIKEY